jgi:hypothetical protein
VTTAGYSGTPLPRKLGVREGSRLLLDGAPAGFDVGPLPPGAVQATRAAAPSYDVVVLFASQRSRLVARWPVLVARLTTAGRLWVAWPKRASGQQTDLGEGEVRAFGLEQGLVDVKVCAVDATWSGLAFVTRLSDRK